MVAGLGCARREVHEHADAQVHVDADADVDAGVDAGADVGADVHVDTHGDAAARADAGSVAEATPGEGIGAARIGMTRAALVAALGKPDKVSAKGSGEYMYFAGGGLQVSLDAGKVRGAFAFSGVAGGYEKATRRFDVRAPKGIGFDATPDQVVAALGVPEARGELTHAPIPSRWIAYAGISFEFVKATGKMISISVTPKAAPAPSASAPK